MFSALIETMALAFLFISLRLTLISPRMIPIESFNSLIFNTFLTSTASMFCFNKASALSARFFSAIRSAAFFAIPSLQGFNDIPPATIVNVTESPVKLIYCNSLVALVSLSNKAISEVAACMA